MYVCTDEYRPARSLLGGAVVYARGEPPGTSVFASQTNEEQRTENRATAGWMESVRRCFALSLSARIAEVQQHTEPRQASATPQCPNSPHLFLLIRIQRFSCNAEETRGEDRKKNSRRYRVCTLQRTGGSVKRAVSLVVGGEIPSFLRSHRLYSQFLWFLFPFSGERAGPPLIHQGGPGLFVDRVWSSFFFFECRTTAEEDDDKSGTLNSLICA